MLVMYKINTRAMAGSSQIWMYSTVFMISTFVITMIYLMRTDSEIINLKIYRASYGV